MADEEAVPIMKRIGPFIGMTVFFAVFLFVVALIFFGTAYHNEERVYHLNVYCIDIDGGEIGEALVDACQQYVASSTNTLPTMSIFEYGHRFSTMRQVKQAITAGDAYLAVVAKNNASSNLNAAVDEMLFAVGLSNESLAGSEAITAYDPEKATAIVYDAGRNAFSTNTYILPPLRAFMQAFTSEFASAFWAAQLRTSFATVPAGQLANFSSLIVQPTLPKTVVLHPTNMVAYADQQIGLIILVVFAFLSIMASLPLLRATLGPLPSYKRWLVILLWGHVVTFFMTLAFTGTLGIFNAVPSSRWVTVWMINWLQQLIYYFSLSATVPIFKERTGLIFCLFLVLNITSTTQNLEIEQAFYQWGYATPFYHALQALRYVFFGSDDQISTNIPALIGMYIFSSCIALPGAVYLNARVLVPRGMGIPPPPPKQTT